MKDKESGARTTKKRKQDGIGFTTKIIKKKITEYNRKYYSDENNLKHKREKDRKYALINREKALVRVKKYYENNKERCKFNAKINKQLSRPRKEVSRITH